MPDVFINFRTGDEESAAALIETELSRMFGTERIFRDSKSIRAGTDFAHEIVRAVRKSTVLLAVIGDRWLLARGKDGRNALDDENDWIRRELVEANDHGVRVVPVLIGANPTPLSAEYLPPELSWLADRQHRLVNIRNDRADIRELAVELTRIVPGLTFLNEHEKNVEPAAPTARNVTTLGTNNGNVNSGEGVMIIGDRNRFGGGQR